jgi:hypothetical protein
VSSSLTGEESRKELKEKDGLPPSAAGKESSLLWANDILIGRGMNPTF